MRLRLVRFFSLAALMFALQFLNLGCSSSDAGEGQGEEVAAEEGGNEEESPNNAEGGNEEVANAENQGNNETQGNNAEGGNDFANNEQGDNNLGAQNADDPNANAGFENQGNALAENNATTATTGEEDLNQIIEELNAGNAAAQAPGSDAVANAGNPLAGAEAPLAAPTPEAAPTAAAPAAMGSPAGPGLPEIGSKMSYIVQKGDTLAKIAARIYGESNKWTEIANFTGIANPRLIYPGDVVYYQLTERSMAFASTYESVKRSEVQIQQGDTLATIAGRVLGNSSLWKLIWRHNDRIDNPDRLSAGMTLYYVDPAAVAAMDQSKTEKFAKDSTKAKAKFAKVNKTPVFEVANDQVNDLFSSHLNKDLMKRT